MWYGFWQMGIVPDHTLIRWVIIRSSNHKSKKIVPARAEKELLKEHSSKCHVQQECMEYNCLGIVNALEPWLWHIPTHRHLIQLMWLPSRPEHLPDKYPQIKTTTYIHIHDCRWLTVYHRKIGTTVPQKSLKYMLIFHFPKNSQENIMPTTQDSWALIQHTNCHIHIIWK